MPLMAVSLLSSCGGDKPGPTPQEDVKFSVQESSVSLNDDKAIIHLDWTPSDRSIEFTNFTFALKDQTSITSTVTPKEATSRPLELTIAFNSVLTKDDVGDLKFHFNDKTAKKEGEGKIEGINILKNTYSIHFEGEFCTINGDFIFSDTVIKDKENAKYTIVPSDGYNLPETIGMPEGISYQYDMDTGVINIDKVTKNIDKITATAILDESYCAFHFEGTNCSISGIKDFDDTIKKGGTNIKYTISPDVGYKLPTKVEPEGKVTYDNTTGVITISEMNDSVSITAETTEQFEEKCNISFSGTNCTATGEGITSQDIFNITATNTDELQFTIASANSYELTSNINFKINNVTADPTDYSYLPDTATTGNYILKFYPKGETVIGIEAKLKEIKYDITFDSNGGSAVKAVSVVKGETTNPPTDPTRSGYAFDGWYYDDDTFEYKFDFATTAIYESVELHAKWTVNNIITLTFDAGVHGLCEINFERKYELDIAKGTKWQNINNRVYGGYIDGLEFLCWTLDGYTPMSDDYEFSESATLQARYVSVSQEFLTLTPRSNATLTINPPGSGTRTFSYQRTGDTEPTLFTGSTNVDLNYGQQIYFKGFDNNNVMTSEGMFDSSDYFSVSGLCGSLFETPSSLPTSAFNALFRSTSDHIFSLISAHNLLLPETTLLGNCYGYMFDGVTSLLFSPKLPATTLANQCYGNMFNNCTNLKVSDSIPEETTYIYTKFFITPSEIPDFACLGMFERTGGTYTSDPVANSTYYYYN